MMYHHALISLRLAAAVALALLLGGCPGADIFGLDTVAEPAVIIYDGDTAEVTVPESVARGVSFELRVRTFGGGCVRETGRTNVVERGREVVILPYNKRHTGDDVCLADILFLTHSVKVTLDSPGEFTLRIVGHRRDRSTNFESVAAELTVPVTVH